MRRIKDRVVNWALVAVLTIVILMTFVHHGFGATVAYPLYLSGELDSVRIVLYRSFETATDSSLVTTFPNDTTVSLDDAYNWTIMTRAFYAYDTVARVSATPVTFASGGTATVDYDALDSVMTLNHGSGAWTSGSAGSGTNDWTIYVRDTNTGAMIPNAKVVARTLSGTPDAIAYTDGSGKVDFTVALDSFRVQVYKPLGSDGADDTVSVAVDGQVDTTYMAFSAITTASAPDLATLFCVYYHGSEPVKGAQLRVSNNSVATDTTQGTIIGPFFDYRATDTSGVASVYVPKSYLYSDSLKSLYNIVLIYRGQEVYTWKNYYVPDQDTVRLEVTD